MSRKKKILILSEKSLEDYTVWSGSMYNMNQAFLKQGFETEWLPLPKFTEKDERLFIKIEKLYNKIFNRGFNRMQFLTKAIISAKYLKREIKNREFDYLFAPISSGYIPFLKIKQPIIYLNDANAAQIFNYNILFTGFGYLSKKVTRYLEKRTLKLAKADIFSNNWGRDYAINVYKIPASKVHVVRFGANMPIPSDIQPKNKKEYKPLNLLFLAGRWELKGGDIAYEAYKILKQKGYDINFTIVGCKPELEDKDVKIIDFIDKNTKDGIQKLTEIFMNSDLFILPTRNDCSPIVTCEASGFAVPTITTITGGVHEIILNDYNGYTLPYEARGDQYAAKIEYLINHPNELNRLSQNARKRYEDVLNWDVWGEKMKEIINTL